jgi:hypothetical protein
MRYRYVGDHAVITEQGVPLAAGEFIELSDQEAAEGYAKDMIDNGVLIEAAEEQPKSKKTTKEEGS